MVAARGVSKLRAWATKYLVVADGPRKGKRWKPGGPAWVEVLDACDDAKLEQVTIRGSVQSGKTATLIAAALGHFAAGAVGPVLRARSQAHGRHGGADPRVGACLPRSGSARRLDPATAAEGAHVEQRADSSRSCPRAKAGRASCVPPRWSSSTSCGCSKETLLGKS